MRALVVPWTIFTPVGGGDFFPRVIECVLGGENFHRRLGARTKISIDCYQTGFKEEESKNDMFQ